MVIFQENNTFSRNLLCKVSVVSRVSAVTSTGVGCGYLQHLLDDTLDHLIECTTAHPSLFDSLVK